MNRPRIAVTRRIPHEAIALLSESVDVDYRDESAPPSTAELHELAGGKDGILCLLTERIDAATLDAAGSTLRVIANMAVGYDNIDVLEANRRGIVVTNTPDVLTETTADLAMALMLSVARRLPEGARFVKEGRWTSWDPLLLLGFDLCGSTLGLVGLGRIGSAVARRARGFGMRIVYHDPRAPLELGEGLGATPCGSFDELLETSDLISIHAPLTPETAGLFDERAFRRMKRTAILVNTARGPIVDPVALHDALREGIIAGAGLDVTEPEPLPSNHPLLDLPNCLVIPHLGSATYRTRARMACLAAENLLAVIQGRTPSCVVKARAGASTALRF